MPTIYRFGEGTEHHRIYVDESAYPPVCLFDHSGPTPDRTEDGPLYVIQNTKGTAAPNSNEHQARGWAFSTSSWCVTETASSTASMGAAA